MKKTTKILSLILTVLTLFSVFSVATPVFAEEVTEATSESSEIIDETPVTEGTETEVNEEAEIVSEIEDMRTEYTKYFRMSDGSYMAAQYAQPVHYEENGEWKEYDYSITENENTNEFVIENSDSEMSFPEEFSEDNETQIEVSARDYDIKFSPVLDKKIFKNTEKQKGKVKYHKHLKSNEIASGFLEEAPAEEKTDELSEKLKIDNQKSAIAYEEIYDNVDLEYEISSNKIKESIVLNSKQDKNKFEFIVDTDGLFPKKETDGSITLYEDAQYTKAVSSIMKPYMYDAKGVFSYDVTMDIKEKQGTYILTVKASNNWLNDKERAYPVVIDPTIFLDIDRSETIDCYVTDLKPSERFWDFLYAGYNSYGKARTYVKFELPTLPDKCSVITNARLRFYQCDVDLSSGSTEYLNIHKVTEEWSNDSSFSWANKPEFEPHVIDYAKIKSGQGEYLFDITKLVREWYENDSNNGVMLKTANETAGQRVELLSAESGTDAYPAILITYRNNKGIEDYWSYSGYSNDTAGAAYINDYTGNLVYELPILSSISEIMPLTLTAVYNTYTANTKFSAGKEGSSRTTPGKGFKLNIQQTVISSSKYNLKGVDTTNYPYVYTDADGTEHYIQKVTEDGKTVYKDEDGLGLTLSLTPDMTATYQLTDKVGNRLYFNIEGNLFCKKDANGNQLYIYFKQAADNYEGKQMISSVVDGAGRKFIFDYYTTDGLYNGYIKTITDNANRTVSFTYNSNGFLTKLTYADEAACSLSYYSDENNYGYLKRVRNTNKGMLEFQYNDMSQVKAVVEFGRDFEKNVDVAGQMVAFNRSAYNKTVIRTAGIDGINYAQTGTNGSDDIITTIQFDNEGKPISQQVSFGSGTEIGAGSATYTSGSSTLASANKISSGSSLGKNTINLLKDGNAERSDVWATGLSDTVTTTKGNSTVSYMGKNSLKITNSGFTGKGASYYRQVVSDIEGEKTYTLSAYVKADALTEKYNTPNKGAYLQLTAYDSNDKKTGDNVYSEKITKKTDTLINNGWRRISVTITTPDNTKSLRAYLCLRDVTGTVYFDCIQLEKDDVANSYNMLENSSFENSTSDKPNSWTEAGAFTISKDSSGTVLDGTLEGIKKKGEKSLIISGAPNKGKGMSQKVAVKANNNDTYIVSGWAFGYAVNTTCHEVKPLFEILARVYYTKTDSAGNKTTVYQDKTTAKFNTTISEWQYSSASFALKYTKPDSGCTYTPTHILVMPRYCYQENHAYFDHIQLIKDAGQTHTYTYDEDGNIVSTAVNTEQKVNTKYDDNNDLTEYTDTAGYKTTATYDSKHNLKSVKSPKGVLTKNAYTDQGNLEATAIKNSSETLAVRTSKAYNAETTSGGFTLNAGAQVTEDRDQHGYKTKYTYDHKTGVLTSAKVQISDTEYVTTTKKYDDSFTKPIKVTTENTSVAYSYTNDRLSEIVFSGTDKKSETYGFTYDDFGSTTKTTVGGKPLSTKSYYDNNGPLKTSVYGNNDKLTYFYNKYGQVRAITKTDNEGSNKVNSKYFWTYTSTGVTQSHTDEANNRKYLYDYDSLGRLTRQEIQTNDASSTHIGATEVTYDIRNNITKVAAEFGGQTKVDEYLYEKSSGNANAASYAQDNLVSRYRINGSGTRYVDYTYDALNRLTKQSLALNGTALLSKYSYYDSKRDEPYTTTQLETETLDNTVYKYYYDKVGNITGVDTSKKSTPSVIETSTSYAYDKKNQLLSETITKKDADGKITATSTTSFTYDDIGNITEKTLSDGTTIAYNYGKDADAGWNHILTSVDLNGDTEISENEKIDYDAIGNPTKYLGASLTWNGRELTGYNVEDDAKTTENEYLDVKYTYDADGLKATKTVTKNDIETKHTYHYVSGQLRYEERGSAKFYYFYDASGKISLIQYYSPSKTVGYYTLTNSRGDVIALYDGSGKCVVEYEYDAWGNCTIVSDSTGFNFGKLNPIRYRGYYYDSETGLYYLQSRYYNSQVGRFLNSDNITDSNAGVLGYNTFLYCANNPVNACDPTGHSVTIGALAGIGVAIGTIIKGAIALVAPYAAKILVALGTTAVGAAVCGGISYAKTKSQARAKAAEEADTIIKDTVKENSRDRYWKASKINGVVTIGNAIDYNTAVEEVKAGRNVFTVTRVEAEMVAYVAGGKTKPMHDPKHEVTEPNYYDHYHIHDHANGAHVWYLF